MTVIIEIQFIFIRSIDIDIARALTEKVSAISLPIRFPNSRSIPITILKSIVDNRSSDSDIPKLTTLISKSVCMYVYV